MQNTSVLQRSLAIGRLFALIPVLALAACSSSGSTPPADSGPSGDTAGQDARTDAGTVDGSDASVADARDASMESGSADAESGVQDAPSNVDGGDSPATDAPDADGSMDSSSSDSDAVAPDVFGDSSVFDLYVEDNPYNNLSKWVVFSTLAPTTATIHIYSDSGSLEQTLSSGTTATTDHRVAVLGLHATTNYSVDAEVGTEEPSNRVNFSSGALPADFPTITIQTLDATRRQPGYELFTAFKKTDTSDDLSDAVPVLVGLDGNGEVVYYLQALNSTPGGAFMVMNDGSIIYADQGASRATVVDGMGGTISQFFASDIGGNFFDHGVQSLPGGDWAALVNTAAADGATGLTNAAVVEITPQAAIVHSWPLDAVSAMYSQSELRDVGYDARDDSLVVLLVDGVIKLNRTTGSVIWEMAGSSPTMQFTGAGYFPPRMHGLQVLANGDLMVFDNGNAASALAPRSVQLTYSINADAGSTVSQAWTYTPGAADVAADMGNSLRFANGNTLVNEGGRITALPTPHVLPRILEVTNDSPSQVVFQMQLESVFNGLSLVKMYVIYKVTYLDTLYRTLR